MKTNTEQIICTTACAYGRSKEIGIYALAEAVNDFAAARGIDPEIKACIKIPQQCRKPRLNSLAKNIESICRTQGLRLTDVRQEKSPAVILPTVFVICTGKAAALPQRQKGYRPGQDIVLTKWTGMDGMLRILSEREQELKERFAPAFIKQIKNYQKELFVQQELKEAESIGAAAIIQVKEGGVLAALWELAKAAKTGIELDIKKISILQETIEVCENYRLNPYQLTSAGSFLIVCDDGEVLSSAIKQQGTEASVIGRLTDNNDKIIHNGEEVRYIDRPVPDEMGKMF